MPRTSSLQIITFDRAKRRVLRKQARKPKINLIFNQIIECESAHMHTRIYTAKIKLSALTSRRVWTFSRSRRAFEVSEAGAFLKGCSFYDIQVLYNKNFRMRCEYAGCFKYKFELNASIPRISSPEWELLFASIEENKHGFIAWIRTLPYFSTQFSSSRFLIVLYLASRFGTPLSAVCGRRRILLLRPHNVLISHSTRKGIVLNSTMGMRETSARCSNISLYISLRKHERFPSQSDIEFRYFAKSHNVVL